MATRCARIGAVPTSVPAPEVYTALERGTFQASSFPFSYAFAAYKLHEVSKWYTMGMHFGIVNNAWVFSQDRLRQAAGRLQEADGRRAARSLQGRQGGLPGSRRAQSSRCSTRPLERITFTPETLKPFIDKAGKPVWDKWVADNKAKGLPAQEALDLVLKTAEAAKSK